MKYCREWFGTFAKGLALVAMLVGASGNALADTITFNFNQAFSGATPAGAGTWLTATFTDVAPGSVTMTVTASGLSGSESIDSLYFNIAPALNPASLTFVRSNASTGPTAANTTINLGTDGYKADGDGYYDIQFVLPPPPGTQAARFEAGETLIYAISGATSLSAASFFYLSAPGGGSGPFYAAAHVQQIGIGLLSGWVAPSTVPLPGALMLLVSGLGFLARFAHRSKRAG